MKEPECSWRLESYFERRRLASERQGVQSLQRRIFFLIGAPDFQEGEMSEYLVQPYSRKLEKDNFRDYDDILEEFTSLVKGFPLFPICFRRRSHYSADLRSCCRRDHIFDIHKNLRKIGYFGVDCIKDVYENRNPIYKSHTNYP